MKHIFTIFFLAAALGLNAQNLVISEIMYNPPESGTDSLEFIEILNNDAASVDMSGMILTYSTTQYTFPSGTNVPAAGYIVVATDSAAFHSFYGFAPLKGPSNGISNSGTSITLKTSGGTVLDSVLYSNAAPWPTAAAGNGASMELCDPSDDNNVGANWSAAIKFLGIVNLKNVFASPGAENCNSGSTTPMLSFSQNSITVNETDGTVQISVSIINPDANPTTVDVVLNAVMSTATNPDDFTWMNATLTFPASSSTPQTIDIPIVDDLIQESAETIRLVLQNPGNGASLLDTILTITIQDDDYVTPFGDCENLFFSEYVEGSGNNKALELYNPTSAAADLSQYKILRFSNGSLTPTGSLALSGTLNSGDVYVIANSSADTALLALADQTSGYISHTGNDRYTLVNGTDTVDIFGLLGQTANYDIDTALGGAANHTLVRKPAINKGQLNWTIGMNEWLIYPSDDFNYLQAHTMTPCLVSVNAEEVRNEKLYPNPASDFLRVNAGPGTVCVLYNSTGQIVYNAVLSEEELTISLASLESGVYLVKLISNNGQSNTHKIIKL